MTVWTFATGSSIAVVASASRKASTGFHSRNSSSMTIADRSQRPSSVLLGTALVGPIAASVRPGS